MNLLKSKTVHQTISKISTSGSRSTDGGCSLYEYIHYQFLFGLKSNLVEFIKSKHIFEKLTQEFQTTNQNLNVNIKQFFKSLFQILDKLHSFHYIFKVYKNRSSGMYKNYKVIQCLDIA